MSDFKAKMQTPLGSLQPSPRSPNLRGLLLTGGRGKGKGRGKEREGRRGEGRGGLDPQLENLDPPVIERLSAETRHV